MARNDLLAGGGAWGGAKRHPKPESESPKNLNKMDISEFWSDYFGKKMRVGGGLGALRFFGHLKRALELFISVRMSPLAKF